VENLERKKKLASEHQKRYRERQKAKISLQPGINSFEYRVNRKPGEDPEIVFRMKASPSIVNEIQTFLMNLALDKKPLVKISFN
jgi:hypothetical protein